MVKGGPRGRLECRVLRWHQTEGIREADVDAAYRHSRHRYRIVSVGLLLVLVGDGKQTPVPGGNRQLIGTVQVNGDAGKATTQLLSTDKGIRYFFTRIIGIGRTPSLVYVDMTGDRQSGLGHGEVRIGVASLRNADLGLVADIASLLRSGEISTRLHLQGVCSIRPRRRIVKHPRLRIPYVNVGISNRVAVLVPHCPRNCGYANRGQVESTGSV